MLVNRSKLKRIANHSFFFASFEFRVGHTFFQRAAMSCFPSFYWEAVDAEPDL